MTTEAQTESLPVTDSKSPRIALVLQVNHLEAIDSGFEEGNTFKLIYQNFNVLPNDDARSLFIKSCRLINGYAKNGCWDYAVYETEPENISVNIGPGDYVVVYEDKHFGVYVGVGNLLVINDLVYLGR